MADGAERFVKARKMIEYRFRFQHRFRFHEAFAAAAHRVAMGIIPDLPRRTNPDRSGFGVWTGRVNEGDRHLSENSHIFRPILVKTVLGPLDRSTI